jgi:hypothetical protein
MKVADAVPGLLSPEISHKNSLYGGIGSPLSISHHMISTSGQAGNISVMQITTLLSTRRREWSSLKGRRVVLISPTDHCINSSTLTTALVAGAPFGNPRVSVLHSSQFPCDWSNYLAGKATSKAQQSQKKDVEQLVRNLPGGLKADTENAVKAYRARLQRLLGPAFSKFRITSMGVRNPSIMKAASASAIASSSTVARPLLIDCTCAVISGEK